MNIAIVDDEQVWIDKISIMIKKYVSNIEITSYTDWRTFDYINNDYDIVFFDIELNDENTSVGLSLCRIYKEHYPDDKHIAIILTTHQEYASKGYISHAFRYINKCNLNEELKEALNTAYEILKESVAISFYTDEYGMKDIYIDNIVLIETQLRKLVAMFKNHNSLVLKEKYSDVCSKLIPYDFYPIRKGVLINMQYIVNREHDKLLMKYTDNPYYISKRNISDFKKTYYNYIKMRV